MKEEGKEAFTTHRDFHAARYPSPTSDSKFPSQPLPRLLSPDFCWAEDGDNATGFASGGVESEQGAPSDLDQMRLSRVASMKMVSCVCYVDVGASVYARHRLFINIYMTMQRTRMVTSTQSFGGKFFRTGWAGRTDGPLRGGR